MSDTPFGKTGIDNPSVVTYTDAEVASFLVEELGNVTATAKRMGISRRALKDRLDRRPELKELGTDLIDEIVDTAQHNIFKSVVAGDLGESRFILTTLGKDRGFATRVETNKDPIQVNVRTFSQPNSTPADNSPSGRSGIVATELDPTDG